MFISRCWTASDYLWKSAPRATCWWLSTWTKSSNRCSVKTLAAVQIETEIKMRERNTRFLPPEVLQESMEIPSLQRQTVLSVLPLESNVWHRSSVGLKEKDLKLIRDGWWGTPNDRPFSIFSGRKQEIVSRIHECRLIVNNEIINWYRWMQSVVSLTSCWDKGVKTHWDLL